MGHMAAPRPPGYDEPDLAVVPDQPAPAAPVEATGTSADQVSHSPVIDLRDAPQVDPDAHRVEVVDVAAFARAVCLSCRWTGPARRSRAVAAQDAQGHPGAGPHS